MIRLSRIGRKKQPHYRLVIAEKARDTYGRTLEILGHYHPLQEDDKDKLVLHKERIEHWLSQGAQASNTVNNLLIEAGIIKGDKKRTIGAYKSKKAEEKKEAPKEDKPAKGGDEKVETPTEEPKAEKVKEETPKEEAKAEEKPTDDKKEEPVEEKKA